MKALAAATLTLLLALSLVCANSEATTYTEDTYDFTALGTQWTIKAQHIVVGEVTNVSFVFQYDEFDPLSAVTVRVDSNITEAIKRANNPGTNPPQRENSEEDTPQTLAFVQTGGPHPDGTITQAVGVRVLDVGDKVFLRICPTIEPIHNNGQVYNLGVGDYGTTYSLEESGNTLDQHTISRGWKGLDTTVIEMARISRATLKQPEQMRTFERQMKQFRHLEKAVRLQKVMNKVATIEAALNLSTISIQ